MGVHAVAGAQRDDYFRVGDKPGVVDLQSTLRLLWGVTRLRPQADPDEPQGIQQ
jgi:hypothetical protein